MPGIIDCHSHIAVEGGVNEAGPAVSSMANIADVLNPDDIRYLSRPRRRRHRREHFARQRESHRRPDRRDQAALGKTASELPFQGALPGIKFALGENPKRLEFPAAARRPAALSRHPARRGGSDPPGIHRSA